MQKICCHFLGKGPQVVGNVEVYMGRHIVKIKR
jgi:hypothetical protein